MSVLSHNIAANIAEASFSLSSQLGDMEDDQSESVKVGDHYTTYLTPEIQQEVEKDYAE